MLSALRAINSELPSMLITITHRLYFLYSSLLCHHFSGSNVIASRPFRCAKVPLTFQNQNSTLHPPSQLFQNKNYHLFLRLNSLSLSYQSCQNLNCLLYRSQPELPFDPHVPAIAKPEKPKDPKQHDLPSFQHLLEPALPIMVHGHNSAFLSPSLSTGPRAVELLCPAIAFKICSFCGL